MMKVFPYVVMITLFDKAMPYDPPPINEKIVASGLGLNVEDEPSLTHLVRNLTLINLAFNLSFGLRLMTDDPLLKMVGVRRCYTPLRKEKPGWNVSSPIDVDTMDATADIVVRANPRRRQAFRKKPLPPNFASSDTASLGTGTEFAMEEVTVIAKYSFLAANASEPVTAIGETLNAEKKTVKDVERGDNQITSIRVYIRERNRLYLLQLWKILFLFIQTKGIRL
ncbi:hypothetical protein ACLOJK_028452 [Asimina triloba]